MALKWSLVLFFLFVATSLELEKTQAFNVSQKCEEDTNTFLWEINQEKPKEYAVLMYNAFGKMVGNVSEGDINQTGLLDQCQSAHGPTFSGQYCQEYLLQGTVQYLVGVCVPDSCSEEDVHPLVLHERFRHGQTSFISPTPSILVNQSNQMIKTRCLPNISAQDTSYVACLFVCCLTVAIPLAATMVTALIRWKNNQDVSPSPESCCKNTELNHYGGLKSNDSCSSEMNGSTSEEFNKHTPVCFPRRCLEHWLQAFSLQNTSQGVLSTTSSIPGGGYSSLNGIRALSLLWIINGHNSQMTVESNTDNFQDWFTAARSNPLLVLSSAGPIALAVDTFLLLGGLLSAKSLMSSIKRAQGKMSVSMVAKYFFNRFKRVQPLHLFIVCLSLSLYYLIKWEPYMSVHTEELHECKKHWWANVLLINNFLRVEDLCLTWTWYLSVDFQCYATTPVLLCLYIWNRRVFAAVAGGLLLITTGAGAIITALMHLTVFSPPARPIKGGLQFMIQYYVKPYTRYGPYLIGILTGMYFMTKKDSLLKKKWQAALGWLCSFSIMALVIGLAYVLKDVPPYPSAPHALYQGLHRTFWALAVTWIIVACEEGYGGLIKSFLSLGLWIPISNISFACYLFHPLIIMIHNGVQETQVHYTDFNFMMLFFGRLMLTLMIGYVLTVLVEKPYLLKFSQ